MDPIRWRRLCAALTMVEAALLAVGAAALAVHAALGPSSARATRTENPAAVDLTLAALAVALLVGLLWCARGVATGRGWARGPLLTWQLIQLAVAVQALRDRAAMPMADWQRQLGGLLLAALTVTLLVALAKSRLGDQEPAAAAVESPGDPALPVSSAGTEKARPR